ncbi:hypothetical protein FQA39_LY09293 [Lamprigera yunnana]|nr:hypothetical protein FQA39_LY09293 [Lamprigera yunnana]
MGSPILRKSDKRVPPILSIHTHLNVRVGPRAACIPDENFTNYNVVTIGITDFSGRARKCGGRTSHTEGAMLDRTLIRSTGSPTLAHCSPHFVYSVVDGPEWVKFVTAASFMLCDGTLKCEQVYVAAEQRKFPIKGLSAEMSLELKMGWLLLFLYKIEVGLDTHLLTGRVEKILVKIRWENKGVASETHFYALFMWGDVIVLFNIENDEATIFELVLLATEMYLQMDNDW